MGKWDRRWVPRRRNNYRKYKDYDYEEPPPSPPSPHHPQSNPPVIRDGSGSSWEIEFCKSVHVSWQKVLTAKKYMYCHERIVQWDDSAGEQAFHNAKRTFWEKINGLPLETPLPDPDIYIDKIDWHPVIDPELVANVDKEYFHPDETRSRRKSDWRTKKFYNQDSRRDPDNYSNNLWEKELSQKVDSLKGQSEKWGQYDTSASVKNVSNPWEESYSQLVDSSNNTSWTGQVNNSSGWNQELKHQQEKSSSRLVDSSNNISWKGEGNNSSGWNRELKHHRKESSSQLVDSSNNTSWTGQVNNSSGWNQELKHQREESSSRLVDSSNNTSWTGQVNNSSGWNQELKHQRECTVIKRFSDSSWKHGCRDVRYSVETEQKQYDQTGGWKLWNVTPNDQHTSLKTARWRDEVAPHTEAANKTWENKQLKRSFEVSFGSDRGYHSGWRKREGCFQNRQRYKTSRFQVDHGADYRWRKER